ncbi:cell death regulator Aven [Elysia marginata]|uniref:Cell death regulator Aven n=1 Tax=Elysia marginata TaxID=1093978 RepID=A0AAV4HGR6_9GAST|nr:cell death regulator Aven [Elysia marginata]
MRPDEHKKKKNAAYKKKHGIGQTKSEKGEDKAKQKKGDQNKSSTRDIKDNKGAIAPKKETEQVASSSSDSEVEQARPPRKTFQRRQIVSNWQKYEIQPENEEKETRGESFEKLLSMSGDAVAHFRFKDEQEWDVVGELAESQNNKDYYGQFLNVDTQEIGQAMDCLPLYKVLGLDPKLFPNAEMESMEKTAADNRQKLTSQLPTSLLASALLKLYSKDTSSGDRVDHVKDVTKHPGDIPYENLQAENATGSDLSGPSLTTETCPKTSPAVKDRLPTNTSLTDTCEKLVLEDEDLDSLLDLDAPVTEVTSGVKAAKLNDTSKSTIEKLILQDKDLDSLLDLDAPGAELASDVRAAKLNNTSKSLNPSYQSEAVNESGKMNFPSASTNQEAASLGKQESLEKPQKDGVDLEDWLDSILDD